MEKKQKMRVNQNHWQIIVEFGELHPEIITNRFSTHIQGKQNNKLLWEDLAIKLNALGQGTRTVEEWKKTIADWKSKTKKKARENYKDLQKTGGGPSTSTPLTSLEERLISLMGKTSVCGDVTVAELGIKRKVSESLPDVYLSTNSLENDFKKQKCNVEDLVEDQTIIIGEILADHDYSTVCEEENADIPPNIIEHEVTAENSTNYVESCTDKRNSKIENKYQKKKSTEEMHNEIVTVLGKIENNVSNISTSLQNISVALNIVAEYLVKNDS